LVIYIFVLKWCTVTQTSSYDALSSISFNGCLILHCGESKETLSTLAGKNLRFWLLGKPTEKLWRDSMCTT